VSRIRPAAVIFDYGNVLCAPQGRREIEAMASILNTAVDPFLEAYWKLRLAYDAAELDPAEYWRKTAQLVSGRLTESQIAELIEIDSRSWAYPAAYIPEWARNLHRAGLKTALLSNMPVPVRDFVTQCDWLPPFHHRTFSCDLHAAKPAPEVYRSCIDALAVSPSHILFLDDRPENVRAAETLGLLAIVYRSAEQAAFELRTRFDMPVPLVATV
jgi:putative hydrolase of the HAD superfamily